LHSAIGYLAPADKLNRLEQVTAEERDRKLEEARARRLRRDARRRRLPNGFSGATMPDGLDGG
jgi:hypothetical protein